MRQVMFFLATVSFLSILPVAANAASCTQLANNCIKNGGTKEGCFAPDAMAYCKKNCEMIGPYTGKRFPATSGCEKKK